MIKRIFPFLMAIALLGSCAKKISFNPSTTVPGAAGSVKIKKDKHENYAINMQVRNLPKPDDLQPPKRSYAVWMETNDNRALNIGSVSLNKGLFSKERKGELETKSSFRPVRVFITPEDQRDPQIPGAEPILSTSLFKTK